MSCAELTILSILSANFFGVITTSSSRFIIYSCKSGLKNGEENFSDSEIGADGW
jgi:hypothetical protein